MAYNKKPYRVRAEVLVRKGDLVLIILFKSKGENPVYGFPGGGQEPGEEIQNCAERELMERAYLEIENVRHTGEVGIKEGYHPSCQRFHEKYRGSRTHLFEADFVSGGYRNDDKIRDFLWVSVEETLEKLENTSRLPGFGTGPHAINYLRKLIEEKHRDDPAFNAVTFSVRDGDIGSTFYTDDELEEAQIASLLY